MQTVHVHCARRSAPTSTGLPHPSDMQWLHIWIIEILCCLADALVLMLERAEVAQHAQTHAFRSVTPSRRLPHMAI